MLDLTPLPQSDLPAVFVANGLGICLVLFIFLSRYRRSHMTSCDGKLFSWMCLLCLTLCLLETAGFFLDGHLFAGAQQIILLCNSLVFLLAILLAYIWTLYVDYRLFGDVQRLRRVYPLAAIPAVLLGLLIITNLFTPIFFEIDESNTYRRSTLFFVPWLVVFCYLTYSAVMAYYYRRRLHKYLFMPVLMFVAPIYIGGAIQLMCYGLSLIWASVAVALTFLYINLQNEENCLDPLTGLYNRNYLLYFLEHLARQPQKNEHITGILLDVDQFKQINDTYGHMTGDGVLQATGKILLRSVDRNATVIRYGGDEFLIFLEHATPEDLMRIHTNIDREVRAYNDSRGAPVPLSLSAGIADLSNKDTFQFFQEMDRKMYEKKRASGASRSGIAE